MAYSFGDSFDLYNVSADWNGFWDSAAAGAVFLQTGRGGGHAWNPAGGSNITKISPANDLVHHVVFQTYLNSFSGSTLVGYFTLYDGATAQCSVVFRSDGALLLQAGVPGGATLATYTGAVPLANTWYAFEIEVIIHPTIGSFSVRRDASTTTNFTAGSLNTRATANSYANKIMMGVVSGAGVSQTFDDFFWKSDAAIVQWIGDLRCYVRLPSTDAQAQFQRNPLTGYQLANNGNFSGTAQPAGFIRMIKITMTVSGTAVSLTNYFDVGGLTGHAKMAIYDANGPSGGPGNLIATTVELTNPPAGAVSAFAIIGSPHLDQISYWLAIWNDAPASMVGNGDMYYYTLAYTTAWPASIPSTVHQGGTFGFGQLGVNITRDNASCVADPVQDGLATYVSDSNVGDADFYTLAPMPFTPSAILAVTTRVFMQKTDTAGRTANAQLNSGGTVVATPTITLPVAPTFAWASRTDAVDPNTGAAWTPSGVNALQFGPKVVA